MLGPVRAWLDDIELDLGSRQQRATLASAASRGKLVTVQELLGMIWGDELPRSAIGTLRTYISRLRRVLSADVVDSANSGYAMRLLQGELDLAEFREWTAAARPPATTAT